MLFGNLGGASTGAFGQPAQQSGAGTAGNSGAFSFGAQNQSQNKPLSLFGNAGTSQPALNFGANQSTSNLGNAFGGGTQFGNPNSQQPNQQQNQPQQQNSFFGGGLGTGGSGIFGSSLNTTQNQTSNPLSLTGGSSFGGFGNSQLQNTQQQQQFQPIQASIDQNPYGNNPIFANVQAAHSSGPKAIDAPQNGSLKKQPALALSYRGTPRSPARITKLRGFATSASSPSINVGRFGSPAPAPGTPLGSSLRSGTTSPSLSLSLSNSLSEGITISPQAFVNRSSVKKLVIDKSKHGDPELLFQRSRTASRNSTPVRDSYDSARADKPTFNASAEISNRIMSSDTRPPPYLVNGNKGDGARTSGVIDGAASTEAVVKYRTPVNADGRDPREGQYYSKPSLQELRSMSNDELAQVHGLVVGRKGYGEVSWYSEPVDLSSLPSVDDLFGGVVVIEEKQVQVYPEEYEIQEPEIGQGLNRPATISIDQCWVKDKATRAPIKDAGHPRIKQHIAKLSKQQGFLSYAVDTGTWSFKVEHFSIYVG